MVLIVSLYPNRELLASASFGAFRANALLLMQSNNNTRKRCKDMEMYNTQLMYMLQPISRARFLKVSIRLLFAISCGTFVFSATAAVDEELIQQQFEEAMDDRESGKVFDAIQMFENILSTNPYLNRARLELAVAYHEASRYQDAIDQFQIVLDDPETPESVRLSILAYMAQLKADQAKPEGEHVVSYYAKAGLIYNTNVNVVPGVGTIIVNGKNFFLPSEEISSVGTDIVLSASHRYRRKKPLDVAGARTSFEWQSQASISSNLYTETSDFNLNIISADTGPAFISPGRWLGAIPLRVDQVYLGSSALATAFSMNPYLTFDLGNYRSILLESTLLSRSYADSINEPQDGTFAMVGLAYTTLFTSLNTGTEIGVRYRDRDAEDDQFGFDGFTLYASGYTTLNELSNIYAKANYRTFEYKAPDTIVDSTNTTLIREDDELTVSVGYNRDFKDGFLEKWTFNTELAYTDNTSNIDAYKYDRWLFSANFSRYIQ